MRRGFVRSVIGTRWGCSLSVVFAQHESSLSIGFVKSKDEVKTALMTGVLFVSFTRQEVGHILEICVVFILQLGGILKRRK